MNLEALIARQQSILNTAKADKRELTAEEQREFDNLQKQIDEIKGNFKQEAGECSDAELLKEESIQTERKRCAEITTLCKEFGVSTEEERGFISGGMSLDSVRAAILEKMKAAHPPIGARATVTEDEGDKFRRAAVDALIMRSGMNIDNVAEGADGLRHMSLKDLAIESMKSEHGDKLYRMSPDEIFNLAQKQFYNPTAAFPAILDNAINKSYVEGHKTVPVTFDRFTKKGSLKDFKVADHSYVAGPAGEFLEVPESGELKHDVLSDAKRPTRKLKTYGRQFTLSRKAFINDDIDLITKMPAKYAAAARKTINKQVYEVMLGTEKIYDGKPLFDKAVHANVMTTGTGVTQEAVQAMMLALQSQTNEFGEPILVRPAKIVVPVGLKFDVFALFNSPTINTAGNTQAVNPLFKYAQSIEVIEDATINAIAGGFGKVAPWFLIGDGVDTDFIQVDYLNGNELPMIRRMEVPGTLGFVWDIFLDWGISVMDYRGAVKNPGIMIKNPLD